MKSIQQRFTRVMLFLCLYSCDRQSVKLFFCLYSCDYRSVHLIFIYTDRCKFGVFLSIYTIVIVNQSFYLYIYTVCLDRQ